jgi:hypothetical protein
VIYADATAYSIPTLNDPEVVGMVGTWIDSPAEWVGLQIQEADSSISTKLTAKKARDLAKALMQLADQVEGV